MKRVKIYALAVFAAMALTATVGAASASAGKFDTDVYPSSIEAPATTGISFSFNGAAINCANAFPKSFVGGGTGGPTGTLTPTGGNVACTSALGSFTLEVKVGSCGPILNSGNQIVAGKYAGSIDIGPPGCTPIKLNGSTCDIYIGAQTGLGGSELVNLNNGAGSSDDTVEIKGSAYLAVTSEGSCKYTNGNYVGRWEAKGFNAGGKQIGVRVHEPSIYMGGAGFEAEYYPAPFYGTQDAAKKHVLNFSGRPISCEGVFFGGAMSAASTALTLETPVYEGCTGTVLGLKFPAEVAMNSCTYGFNSAGTMDVKCSKAGDAIEAKIILSPEYACVYKVGAQTGRAGVSYSTIGEGINRKIGVTFAVKTLAYTATPVGAACGEGTLSGAYSGSSTLSGLGV